MLQKISNKKELLQQVILHEKEIKSFGVKDLLLFGSFAKNAMTEASDVDMIVSFEEGKKNYDNFINLSFFLENIFGRKTELFP